MVIGTVADFFNDFFKPELPPRLDPSLVNIINTIYDNRNCNDIWIAGGMARQLALDPSKTTFSDIDVWFKDPKQFNACLDCLIFEFGSTLWKDWESDNATTLNVGEHKVQLIKRQYFNNVQEVFDYFDFTCCQIAIDKDLNIYGPGIDDARNFILRLNKLDKENFIARYAKYVGYGYVMDNDAFLDIINNESLNYDFDGNSFTY